MKLRGRIIPLLPRFWFKIQTVDLSILPIFLEPSILKKGEKKN